MKCCNCKSFGHKGEDCKKKEEEWRPKDHVPEPVKGPGPSECPIKVNLPTTGDNKDVPSSNSKTVMIDKGNDACTTPKKTARGSNNLKIGSGKEVSQKSPTS